MTRTRTLALLGAVLVVGTAHASSGGASYPTNVCVGTKQNGAGKYCASVLKAWSRWERDQNASTRDQSIQSAGTALSSRWSAAESRSKSRGAECAETTVTAAAAEATIEAAAAALVAQVNSGLDLSNPDHASCGSRLVKAAAKACSGLLAAEGRRISNPARDAQGLVRDAAQDKARARFQVRWAKQSVKGCPTTATEGDVEAALGTIDGDVVHDTTISPTLDDTQYTTVSPTGITTYLGRDYAPKCVNGSPYHFFVKRGTQNKVLYYFQGGGACWEQLTCSAHTCTQDVDPNGTDSPNFPHPGFADPNNPANPFRDWSQVFVAYCSCDIHFGDAAQDYTNFNPSSPYHVEHRGFENARVVEKFAREHFVDPNMVFVAGSSAGAYGAQLHAPLLQEVWPAAQFAVLADAGNGVITQNFLETYFPNWNFEANLPPEFPQLKQVIDAGTGIPGYTEAVASIFPRTRFAHYATAYDGSSGGQTGFYAVMLNNNNPVAALTWWTASCQFNPVLRAQAMAQYNTITPLTNNYRYYIGTGSRHTMWGSDKVYTDTTGGVPLLVDWVNAMIGGTPAWTNVECTNCGLLLSGDPQPPSLPTEPFEQSGSDVIVNCP
jgi:pectinacetylesterase